MAEPAVPRELRPDGLKATTEGKLLTKRTQILTGILAAVRQNPDLMLKEGTMDLSSTVLMQHSHDLCDRDTIKWLNAKLSPYYSLTLSKKMIIVTSPNRPPTEVACIQCQPCHNNNNERVREGHYQQQQQQTDSSTKIYNLAKSLPLFGGIIKGIENKIVSSTLSYSSEEIPVLTLQMLEQPIPAGPVAPAAGSGPILVNGARPVEPNERKQ